MNKPALLVSLTSDWRWRRAETLVAEGKHLRPTEDEWVKAATRFLRALRRCRSDGDRYDLAQRMPAVHWAHAIQNTLSTRIPVRRRLEAGLRCEMSYADIATFCRTSPAVVEAFAMLFADPSGVADDRCFEARVLDAFQGFDGCRQLLWSAFRVYGRPPTDGASFLAKRVLLRDYLWVVLAVTLAANRPSAWPQQKRLLLGRRLATIKAAGEVTLKQDLLRLQSALALLEPLRLTTPSVDDEVFPPMPLDAGLFARLAPAARTQAQQLLGEPSSTGDSHATVFTTVVPNNNTTQETANS